MKKPLKTTAAREADKSNIFLFFIYFLLVFLREKCLLGSILEGNNGIFVATLPKEVDYVMFYGRWIILISIVKFAYNILNFFLNKKIL